MVQDRVEEAPGRIGVFILARVRLYEEGLAQVLRADPRFAVCGTASGHDDAVARMLSLRSAPHVALLDLGLMSGVASARRLRVVLPQVRVIALAIDDTEEDVIAWAEAGVAGFVTRDTPLDDVLSTIECVALGGARCSPTAAAALLRRVAALAEHRPFDRRRGHLTPREREVVTLIDRGLSNKQIARELQIELATVKNHVHSILDKLRVDRRGAAAALVRGQAGIAFGRDGEP
ncbi:MAG TPA: response regulator transcription factor [Solirubrobacteraceae bacterium]|nr:response regulator transcription factor [Solirubrobacteraceae bacterium]